MNQKSNIRNHASHFTLRTSQKGITLIALVVTIIVMLILAGVVISMVTGDEGIISQSKLANEQQIEKEDMEAIKLAVSGQDMAEAMEDVPAVYNKAEAIEDELRIKYSKAEVTDEGSNSFLVKIDPTDEKRWYTVPANRKIAKVGGTTTTNPTTTNPTSQATTTPTSAATPTPTTASTTTAPTPTTNTQISITELTAGTYVNYIDNNGNTIPCRILYDTAYNTANETNYGIQAITADSVQTFQIGIAGNEAASVAAWNSAIQDLNGIARSHLNTNYATAARCVGSLPSNPDYEGELRDSLEYMSGLITTTVGEMRDEDNNYVEDKNQMLNINYGYPASSWDFWFASRLISSNPETNFKIRFSYDLSSPIFSEDIYRGRKFWCTTSLYFKKYIKN